MAASDEIDAQVAALGDWRADVYARLRQLVHDAAPGIVEDFKWGTAVFVDAGNVCAIGAFKDHMKVNFFEGAALADPANLFNAGLDAKKSRAIDIHAASDIDEPALKELVQRAVEFNRSRAKPKKRPAEKS